MYIKNPVEVVNALKRMNTKVENLRLEFKAMGHPRKYDMDELLGLVDLVNKNLRGNDRNG
jgi:hypothetical protein